MAKLRNYRSIDQPTSTTSTAIRKKTMTAICFVCNLPIMSHQVGLVWQGTNGWDDLVREQMEESTIRQRLGGRRDSAAQINTPPSTSPPPGLQRRRRSSLAQLTDILREWSGAGSKRNTKAPLNRRETLADLARSLPWAKTTSDAGTGTTGHAPPLRKRRESSADSGIRSMKSRRESHQSDINRVWNRRESISPGDREKEEMNNSAECTRDGSRRGSGESNKSGRRDSIVGRATTPPPPKVVGATKKRRDSLAAPEFPNFRQEQRPSTSSTASDSAPLQIPTSSSSQVDSACQALPPPTIIMSSVTPPATSPTCPKGRRDSTTQCGRVNRRDSKVVSPERTPRLQRLQRQATAFDESCLPGGGNNRRGSQPALSPDPPEDSERRARRDSLSPDSASRGRRDSRSHLSPDRSHEREGSPRRRTRLRRQSSSAARGSRSPDSSSCCSSRDPSPCARPPPTSENNSRPAAVRRQSTTEEILISRGFRRQSTTEEMIRCRNFRRQSSQSDDVCSRFRGRRDSSAQIIDGTIGTMTIETTSTFFDSSTQTEPTPLYDNNHYHEECLRCNSCGLNLTGPNQKRARRFKNHILCDLHFADVALMECSDFMQQLRSFKPQSLGCAVARRKSSTTLIFPLPPQACSDEFCEEYPHNLIPTPGYWIECSRQKISLPNPHTIWDDSDSEHEELRAASSSDYLERGCNDLYEDDEDSEAAPSPRKKTTIEEQWEQQGAFELTSVEQETYEKYFYGTEHWNYFTTDEDLGPVILSIKQETLNGRDQFRILVRAISYTVHGLIPASCVFADRYNREEVVRSLGKEVNINPPLTLGQLPDTPEELLKLDQVFIKSELKVGIIYVKENQYTEEHILDNNENSPLFDEFLQVLGDKCRLRGFDKYKGGLDTVHDLTGLYSVYTNWRNIEIMFHVSTLLPYEKHDTQKLQRKRHIGNDIVCVVFLEADNTPFSPACIKSHFLHTFILVRVSARIKRKPTRYEVSVVTRDEVGAYKPYLWEQSVFEKGPMFREWLLTKIVNGERASYSAPKFARMQERTRSQMLEDLVMNLSNHAETGQIPKPYRRGSWRPIGHMRPSSPLLDSVRDQFEDYDQLAKDFTRVFLNQEPSCLQNAQLFDVVFLVGQSQSKQKARFIGVRAILGVRSRVFQEMLYGIQTGFGSPQVPVAEIFSRPAPSLMSPQNQKQKSNYLTVPDIESARPKSVPSSPMVKRAFSRLGTITAGWGRSIRKQNSHQLNVDDKKKWASSQDCSNKDGKDKDGKDKPSNSQLAMPRLSVCADAQKVDRAKLAQTEFNIIEFDPETFRVLLDYLHTGTCPLTCVSIPGLLCAAEHYDLPELLQACFHHCKQFLRIDVVCPMLISLENYYWRYTSASELVNMILTFVENKAHALFKLNDFLNLSESMVQMIMCRDLQMPEIRKFEAMLSWAKNKVDKMKTSPNTDTQLEFRCIMERLTRDLDLCRISPNELISVVLPSKSLRNERIMETLMVQAHLGMYRMQELDEYKSKLRSQDSKCSEGHMRPSSPLLDSVRDQFEDYDQLAKDFTRVFLNQEPSCLQNAQLFDVVFLVGQSQSKQKARFIGVRAILGVRSRVFQEMLYGIQTGFGSPQVPVAEIFSRPAPSLMSPQNQKQKSNYLTVPDIESARPKSVPSSPMVKRAFSRLGTITAGWGRSIRKQNSHQLNVDDKKKWASSQDCSNKDGKDKDGKDKPSNSQLAMPRLSVCADAQKVDRAKLAQTEFNIIEFDPETFRVLLDYLHTGTCPLTCVSIPGLLCAAEHYDLPELLQACFHHCKQFLRIDVVCPMLISLENYYWRYTSASELVNMILTFVENKAHALFKLNDFLNLSESMVQMIMCRDLQMPEIRKFEAMLSWAKNKVDKMKTSPNTDTQLEFRCIMERLTRDLDLCRISPNELISVVLPSKSLRNERIMETLMVQAHLGMYRMQELDEYKSKLRSQDSKCSEGD